MLNLAHALDDFIQPVLHVQEEVVPALRQRGHQSCKGQKNGDEGSGLSPGRPGSSQQAGIGRLPGLESCWKLRPGRAWDKEGVLKKAGALSSPGSNPERKAGC